VVWPVKQVIVKINFLGSREYYRPILDQVQSTWPGDMKRLVLKYKNRPAGQPMRMDIDEAIRLFTVLNSIEKIYFEMA
jgi:hypothetical protein